MYQHIKVPAGGQKITVNADFSLNVPDKPIIPVHRRRRHRLGHHAGDDQGGRCRGAKAYGGKKKIHWMEIYAGEKSTRVYGPDVWLPEETLEVAARVRGLDQGPADDAGRRRHPLAQRRAAPGTRPVRLPAPGAVLQGRAVAGEGAGEDQHGDLPRELGRHLRRHRVRGRERQGQEADRVPAEGDRRQEDPLPGRPRASASSRCRSEGTERLVRKAIQYAIDNDKPSA